MVKTIKSLNTWSVEGSTGWYSVLLGQNRAVLVASMMSFQKIYGLHGLNHQIIEKSCDVKPASEFVIVFIHRATYSKSKFHSFG